MLEIVAPAAYGAQPLAKRKPEAGSQKDIEPVKNHHHGTGIVDLPNYHIKYDDQGQYTDGVRLDDSVNLKPPAHGALRRIHAAGIIHQHIDGNNEAQQRKIIAGGKHADPRSIIQNIKFEIIGRHKG